MKKFLLTLSFSIFSLSTLLAQNYQEVIYLKNGSMIKGVIVEQVPNETYKIETADGSLFVYKCDEVLKITKERVETTNKRVLPTKDYSTTLKYQGEILLGFGAGVGVFPIDRVYIQTIQGVRVNEYFSAGLGLGANILPAYVTGYAAEVYVPIFLNIKGYYPVSKNASIFGSLDIGGAFGVSEGLSGASGFMACPAVGVSIKNRVNISLGYDVQKLSDEYLAINANAVAIKLGCMF